MERVVGSPLSGTTSDAVDIRVTRDDVPYVMIETAGIRRPGKVEEDLDKYAQIRTEDACKRADIILLLLDASTGPVAEDTRIASYAVEHNKPVILVVNKWDIHSHGMDDQKKFSLELKNYFKFLDFAPIVFLSAKTGSNLGRLFATLNEVNTTIHKSVPSSLLNSVLLKAQMDNEAPDFNGGRLRISYATQTKDVPPTFILFCNNPNYFHFSYQRYLENVIRTQFGFTDCPIRLLIRSKREDDILKQ